MSTKFSFGIISTLLVNALAEDSRPVYREPTYPKAKLPKEDRYKEYNDFRKDGDNTKKHRDLNKEQKLRKAKATQRKQQRKK